MCLKTKYEMSDVVDQKTNQVLSETYVYDSFDIQNTGLLCIVLYITVYSLYRLHKYGTLIVPSDPKNIIKTPINGTVINFSELVLHIFGLEKPTSFELLVNLLVELFILFVVGVFILVLMNYCSHKDNVPHDTLEKNLIYCWKYLLDCVFKLTIVFLFYELLYLTSKFLYKTDNTKQHEDDKTV